MSTTSTEEFYTEEDVRAVMDPDYNRGKDGGSSRPYYTEEDVERVMMKNRDSSSSSEEEQPGSDSFSFYTDEDVAAVMASRGDGRSKSDLYTEADVQAVMNPSSQGLYTDADVAAVMGARGGSMYTDEDVAEVMRGEMYTDEDVAAVMGRDYTSSGRVPQGRRAHWQGAERREFYTAEDVERVMRQGNVRGSERRRNAGVESAGDTGGNISSSGEEEEDGEHLGEASGSRGA
ncbi:hypothetical protein QBC42DRAFT_265744 [Cladorrhinum samala]|uniref:Uncharacterized protein n=1 Tax=Cladorrhinum samala TaxID=585594 RepID=A0AAV9HTB3_9PEZI|nr:hypothetical protein QBC42DRAFT_265744 [Cladorrhinum samala]